VALKNSPGAYGSATRFFHWAVVVLVGFQLGSVVLFRLLEEGGTDFAWSVLNAHKTAGLLILILTGFRLFWRRHSPLPDWPASFDTWDKRFSHIVEYGLYTVMFVMALSGIGIELAGGHYVPFFDLFHLDARPWFLHFGAASYAADVKAARHALSLPLLRDLLVGLHVLTGFATVALLAAHLAHVARHQLGLKDGLLGRMLYGTPRPTDKSDS